MTALLLALCVVAARYVAHPYLQGFIGAAMPDARRALALLRFRWRTRSIRWKAWRNPGCREPWTEDEKRAIVDAFDHMFKESRE